LSLNLLHAASSGVDRIWCGGWGHETETPWRCCRLGEEWGGVGTPSPAYYKGQGSVISAPSGVRSGALALNENDYSAF